MKKKLTFEESKKELYIKYPDMHFDFLGVTNINSQISCTCLIHKTTELKYMSSILSGDGCACKLCSEHDRLVVRRDKYIQEAIDLYGDKYNYDKVGLVPKKEKSIIHCNTCDVDFSMSLKMHTNKTKPQGCKICGLKKRDEARSINDPVQVEKEFRQKFGDKFEYDFSNLKNNRSKLKMYCRLHDHIFYQNREQHLSKNSYGCPLCALELKNQNNRKSVPIVTSIEEFILESKKIHGDKFLYDKVDSFRLKDEVLLFCVGCNTYKRIRVQHHLKGHNCINCEAISRGINARLTPDIIIERLSKKHKHIELIEVSDYETVRSLITAKCTIHDYIFKRKAVSILDSKEPCPKCREEHDTSYGERKVIAWLIENSIDYLHQHKFTESKTSRNNRLAYDFFLPKSNTIIEYDGKQHYEHVPFFHKTIEDFENAVKRDLYKNDYCKKHNIKLIRIPYWDVENIESILTSHLLNN